MINSTCTPKNRKPASLLPFAALIGTSLFCLWLLSLQGTLGLIEWMPLYRNRLVGMILAGWIPVMFLVLSFIASRKKRSTLSGISKKLAILFSAFIVIACVGAFTVLHTMMHAKVTTPRLATAPTVLQQKLISEIHMAENANIFSATQKPLLHLAFSSDPHFGSRNSNSEATHSILRAVKAGKYDAIFLLGDFVDQGLPGTGFDKAAHELSEELHEVPISTVMGNHDALVGGEYRYRSIFSPDLYYRVDAEKFHIVVLNLLWGTESLDRKQKVWLAKTLSSIPKKDILIVLTHCFFWSSGNVSTDSGKKWFDHSATTSELAPILEAAGADLVISGHNHFMEYLERKDKNGKKGTAYAIIGAMGGELDSERTYISPYSRWYMPGRYGFIDLELYADRMELTFRNETGMPLYTITR